MSFFRCAAITGILIYCVMASAQTTTADANTMTTPTTIVTVTEPIRPLPENEKTDLDQNKVALGKKLFTDVRLSRTSRINCGSCHDFSSGGADTRAHSVGVDGHETRLNTPTVFNSAFNFRQYWDGRARSLEEQIDLHIKDPAIFDTAWSTIIRKLSADPVLLKDFKNIYANGIVASNIIDAIANFERSLITPSRFDAYLRGDDNAITASEKLGYARFKSYGCAGCHQGINVGGNMFQRLGAMRALPESSLATREADLGRFAVTRKESDKHVFKVPGLRNVALTAPYFHDGSARTLEQAVDLMFTYQLGRTASAGDQALIIRFLQSLNGTPQPKINAGVAP